jgi:hypothetical protein
LRSETKFQLNNEEWGVSSFLFDEVLYPSPILNQNSDDVLYYSNANGPWTKEIFLFDGMCLHIFKMKKSTLGF